MIVKLKKTGIKRIPILNTSKAEVGAITLLPGINDIPDEQWKAARQLVANEIPRYIEEIAAVEVVEEVPTGKKVEKTVGQGKNKKTVEVDEKVKKKYMKGKPLSKLDAQIAESLIKETFNLETLNKWKDKEARDSVRVVILQQIETVENHKGAARDTAPSN